jgi:hypothetical protein
MRQSVDSLNQQVHDFKSSNYKTMDVEKMRLNNEIERLKSDENKNYWRDFYKDKYKSHNINSQISQMNNMLE